MANEVQDFLSSWKQLSTYDKDQLLSTLQQSDLNEAVEVKSASKLSHKPAELTSDGNKIYDGVKLSSYYSYLYYYPTMNWTLDRPPETDDYWVGMFREGAPDYDYVAWQWVGEVAHGSYYVGQIVHTHGNLEAGYYMDQYELRIFRGATRLTFAKTNEMRGSVIIAPTDALDLSTDVASEFKLLETDGMKDGFMKAIECLDETEVNESQISKEDFPKKWNSFTPMQKQLLYPVLKHSSFPDEKKNPPPGQFMLIGQSQKFCFLGKAPQQLKHAEADTSAPTEIVLNITLLQDSYTYVYPRVKVTETVGINYAYMGMYYTQR